MNARDYYVALQEVIHAAPHVIHTDISFDEVEATECYIRGTLLLVGDMELHIAEYVVTEPSLQRDKYRYHLQTAQDKTLVCRWDNFAHHTEVASFPHHLHDKDGRVHPSPPMDVARLLDAVLAFIPADE